MSERTFIFEYRDKRYPDLIRNWRMSRYIAPIAKQFCVGNGVDIGSRDAPFPGAIPVDITDDNEWHAMNLPVKAGEKLDYVFSSHCLEHIPDFVSAVEYWITLLKSSGVIFLYLPHWEMEHWRPWHNRKHSHFFEPKHIKDFLECLGLKNVLVSGIDLASSFSAVGFMSDDIQAEHDEHMEKFLAVGDSMNSEG